MVSSEYKTWVSLYSFEPRFPYSFDWPSWLIELKKNLVDRDRRPSWLIGLKDSHWSGQMTLVDPINEGLLGRSMMVFKTHEMWIATKIIILKKTYVCYKIRHFWNEIAVQSVNNYRLQMLPNIVVLLTKQIQTILNFIKHNKMSINILIAACNADVRNNKILWFYSVRRVQGHVNFNEIFMSTSRCNRERLTHVCATHSTILQNFSSVILT